MRLSRGPWPLFRPRDKGPSESPGRLLGVTGSRPRGAAALILGGYSGLFLEDAVSGNIVLHLMSARVSSGFTLEKGRLVMSRYAYSKWAISGN